VLKHPVLRALVVCYGLYQVAFGVLTVTVTYVAGGTGQAAREHGVRVGLLWALVGIAGVVGALLVGRGSRPGHERRAIVTGILVTSVACAAMALGFAVALVLGLVAVGLAAGPVDVGLLTLRQRRTDPDWLGRVLAVSISLNVLGFPVGSALGGFVLSGTRSAALAFLTAAAAAALGTAAAGLMLPRRTATAA
jgi:predicted MFS family arabinose efflux permease